MKQTMEQPNISPNEKLADRIRKKINQKIPLNEKEEAFIRQQKAEDREGDNPRYGH